MSMHKEIREDLLKDESSQKKALERLIPLFNNFVRENVKTGDYDNYKRIQKEQYNKEVTPEGYITNLAEAYLEPILPLDLEDPFKYQPIIDKLAKLYMESFL
jgi:flagellar biosynthesis protein FliP